MSDKRPQYQTILSDGGFAIVHHPAEGDNVLLAQHSVEDIARQGPMAALAWCISCQLASLHRELRAMNDRAEGALRRAQTDPIHEMEQVIERLGKVAPGLQGLLRGVGVASEGGGAT